MRIPAKAFNAAGVGDQAIDYALFPKSFYWRWLPSGKWLAYRVFAPLFIITAWSLLLFSLLNFIPILFPVFLPVFILPLISALASLGLYFFGDSLRAPILKFYAQFYGFLLRNLFSKNRDDADEIVKNLVEKRSLAQQLIDYINYFLNRPLRADSEDNKNLKIRIAKFNARWGALAKFILNSFFLITGGMLFASSLFGLSLTPAVVGGIIALGMLGGVCTSVAYSNVLGNSLIKLAKQEEKQADTDKEKLSLWQTLKKKIKSVFSEDFAGWLISIIHGFGGGVACFSAGMHFIALLSAYSFVAANPFIAPVLLIVLGFCSIAIARGFYALTYKVWREKKESLKGFFSGLGVDGKPIGKFQRIFGILGALLVGVTIAVAFVMLNGTSFATTIQAPLYTVMGSLVQFNLNPTALFAFIFTGIIGGAGTGIIYFCGCFKLFSDIGKWIDTKLASRHEVKVEVIDPIVEERLNRELKEDFAYSKDADDLPRLTEFWPRLHYKRARLEKIIRTSLIIFFNGIGNGMLAAIPNIVLLTLLSPSSVLPVALLLFSLTAFASICKDYTNWVGGHENRSQAYPEIKNLLREAIVHEENLTTETNILNRETKEKHIVDLRAKAKALKDGYDPHLTVLVLTAIVRILSNSLAVLFLPLTYISFRQSVAGVSTSLDMHRVEHKSLAQAPLPTASTLALEVPFAGNEDSPESKLLLG